MALLVILGGLPGAGKTTLARALARRLGAVHLRIDTIETALEGPAGAAGYRIGMALAADNLKLGLTVIADSVNPLAATRAGWRGAAQAAGAAWTEIEVVCPDTQEHRRRVETRTSDIAGHIPPTWTEVTARDYAPWPEAVRVEMTGDVEAVADRLAGSLGG